MHAPLQHVKVIRIANDSRCAPPRFVEYAFYAYTFYGIMGVALRLPTGLLGSGLLAILIVFCVMSLGSQAMTLYALITFPLGCALSFVVLQLSVHGESLMHAYVRMWVSWILTLTVVQTLSLRRGFLRRFAFVVFVTGLTALPYLRVAGGTAQYERVALERGFSSLSNSNDLGTWFGFCAVYFIIVGIETKRVVVRMASWLVAVGCLYAVGLTLSRGALLGVAIAAIVALRRSLKRGFLPVLLLAILSWIIYESGIFGQAATFYAARATEETGRSFLWPLAFERFLNSPLVGVGVSQVGIYIPQRAHPNTPHNSFLFIAMTSGILPLVFFVAYWWHAARGALRASTERTADAPFYLPLLLYTFLTTLFSNSPFMDIWAVVALSTAMAASAPRRLRRILVRQISRDKTAGEEQGMGLTWDSWVSVR